MGSHAWELASVLPRAAHPSPTGAELPLAWCNPQHRPAGLQEPVLGRMAAKHHPLKSCQRLTPNQQRAAPSWPFPHRKQERLGKGHPRSH